MGHIFEKTLFALYDEWQHSAQGMLLDQASTELIMHLLEPKQGERILDVGCGTGNHLLLFYRLGLDVTGVDASSYMLDIAQSRLGHRASLRGGRAEDLPFEDNEFDITTLIFTLEFLDNPFAALREAGRVTRDRVFIGVLNSLSLGCMVNKIHALFHESIFRAMQPFTFWGVKSMLRKAYGDAPIKWGSVQVLPFFSRRYTENSGRSVKVQSYPHGIFLGVVCNMTYILKTRNLQIAEKSKRKADSIARSFHK